MLHGNNIRATSRKREKLGWKMRLKESSVLDTGVIVVTAHPEAFAVQA